MINRFFPPIQNWLLSESVFQKSIAEMAIDGREGNEGVALWLGRRKKGQAEVTHVVALRGKGVIKKPDFMIIESWLINDFTDIAIKQDVMLVGQIHSHGKGYGTDLSYTDRAYGVAVPSYLSLVAPDYAQNSNTSIMDCGVHVFEEGTGYRRLSLSEISERIRVTNNTDIPLLIVGNEDE